MESMFHWRFGETDKNKTEYSPTIQTLRINIKVCVASQMGVDSGPHRHIQLPKLLSTGGTSKIKWSY